MDARLIIVKCVLVAAVFSVLTACATSPVPLGLPCNVGPVVLDKGASTRLTRGEKDQIVALNETGERLCRWRAP
jgi:hypothetical protein